MGFHMIFGGLSERQRLEREVTSWLDGVLLSSERKVHDFPRNDFPATVTHCFVDYDGQFTVSIRAGGPALGGILTLQLHRDPDGRKKDSREVAAIVAAIVFPKA